MEVIAVINQKGGVGKTTTSINLAYALTQKSKKVILIDLDGQGNSTSGLGIKDHSGSNLHDLLLDPKNSKEALVPTAFKNLSIIPSSKKLASLDSELPATVRDRVLRLKQVLKELDADYIIIDSPPSLGLLTVNALVAANSVLLPVQAEYYALEGLGQMLETMQIIKSSINKTITIKGLLVTMFDARTSLSKQVYKELEKHFAKYLFTTTIPRNTKLAEAPSYGMPIGIYSSKSAGAKAYENLALEVIKKAGK